MNYKMIAMKFSMPLMLAGLMLNNDAAWAEGGKSKVVSETKDAASCKIVSGTKEIQGAGTVLEFGDLKVLISMFLPMDRGTVGYDNGFRFVGDLKLKVGDKLVLANDDLLFQDPYGASSAKRFTSAPSQYSKKLCGAEVHFSFLADSPRLSVSVF